MIRHGRGRVASVSARASNRSGGMPKAGFGGGFDRLLPARGKLSSEVTGTPTPKSRQAAPTDP